MEMKTGILRPGEKELLKKIERTEGFEKLTSKELTPEEGRKELAEEIKKISAEIRSLPTIEIPLQTSPATLERFSNLLALAVNLALTENIAKGLSLIRRLNNPHLLDAFHDLLAGHFFQVLVKHNKIKLAK